MDRLNELMARKESINNQILRLQIERKVLIKEIAKIKAGYQLTITFLINDRFKTYSCKTMQIALNYISRVKNKYRIYEFELYNSNKKLIYKFNNFQDYDTMRADLKRICF